MSRPSIRTVAAAAGVSVATVVRVLDDNRRVSAELRARVLAAIERCGYQRNAIASEVMRRFRHADTAPLRGTLALLTHAPVSTWGESGHYFYREMHAGAEARARALGYKVEVFCLREPGVSLARLASILHARGVQGVMLLPLPHRVERLDFPWESFAAARIGYMLQAPQFPRVTTDYLFHLERILERLQRGGYRRVGYMADEQFEQRLARLVEARFLLQYRDAHGREVVPILRCSSESGPAEARRFAAWFRRHRPDAVVCHHAGPYRWLRELGVRVPGDVGFAAITTRADHPEVSGMLPALGDIGAAAVDQVSQQILLGDIPSSQSPRTLLIGGGWQEGSTLRPPEAAP